MMKQMIRNALTRMSAAGYTFIEMMTVLMVLGIVAALAVPMLGGTATSELAAAARLLAADINHARVASITQADSNWRAVVVFDEDGLGYYLAHVHDHDEPIEHPIDRGPYRVRFGRVVISDIDVDDAPVLAFGRFGQLDQLDPAKITLSAEGRSITLTIDPTTGEVSMSEPQ